jgi:hypothetical protein
MASASASVTGKPSAAAIPPPAIKNVRWGSNRDDRPRPLSPRSDIEEDEAGSLRDSDSVSINSMDSVPGPTGNKMLTFEDERTTTAYEAWELVFVRDRQMRQSWKTFCGIPFSTRWVNRNDGCVLVNPVTAYEQGELADMHEEAGCKYKQAFGTYEQDLATRVHKLPHDIYDQLQHLIEDKTNATNRNPYRKREWHVVLLQQKESQMTEHVPEPRRRGLFGKKSPALDTYLVVLRGREVKSTKEEGGWKGYNRHSNPWWRLDSRETREERQQHKEFMKKMERKKYGLPRPRPHPQPYPPSHFPPRPLPSM